MSVELADGDLFADTAECLVNAVNIVGVMGAGLAKKFAHRWPAMEASYKTACLTKVCRIGAVHMWKTPAGYGATTWIANLPTKAHWRDPSRYEYVEQGLADLAEKLRHYQVTSVAIPALGCGLGGLDFDKVLPLIQERFHGSDIDVRVYPPQPAPARSRARR